MKLFLHSVTLDKFYVLLYGSKQVWGIFGEEEHKICAVEEVSIEGTTVSTKLLHFTYE